MKLFNIIALAYGGSFLTIMALAMTVESLVGKDQGMFIVVPLGLFIGMSARRTAEKLLGYTVLEAMKEGSDDSGN